MVTTHIETQRFAKNEDVGTSAAQLQETYPKITISDINFDSAKKNEFVFEIEKILNEYRV